MNKTVLKICAIITALVLVVSPLVSHAASKTYFDGSAITYKNRVVVGTTNMGGIEVFVVDGKQLKKVVDMHTFEYTYGGGKDFTNLTFKEENQQLYMYAVNGRTLFKYNISDLTSAKLETSVKNTVWDNLAGVKTFGDKLVTVGSNGVSVYDNNLNVLDNYKQYNNHQHNIDLGYFGKRLYSVVGADLTTYSTVDHKVVATTTIFNANGLNRKTWSYGQYLYAVDDKSLMKIDHTGVVVASQPLNGPLGFDVAGSYANNYGYYSNGKTVTKFRLDTLATVKTIKTADLIKNATNWAIGMEVVSTPKGDNVVVFDNDGIVVLDGNLKTIATVSINK